MLYYIVVKMRFVGELYDVSGPYNSLQEVETDFDTQHLVWVDSLGEDEYLGIVSREQC